MPKTVGHATMDLPKVSAAEVRRFDKIVTVHDRVGFRTELGKLIREKASVEQGAVASASVVDTMRQKANALKAKTSWMPSVTEIQRGRVVMLHEFSQPQNLPLTEFAKLAHKSRQQIYKDIAAKRLLALSVGTRGQRLPDWQLDPIRLRLTQAVLAQADDVDEWTLFHALSEPLDKLHGQSSVKAVRRGNLADVVKSVLGALGIHGRESAFDHA